MNVLPVVFLGLGSLIGMFSGTYAVLFALLCTVFTVCILLKQHIKNHSKKSSHDVLKSYERSMPKSPLSPHVWVDISSGSNSLLPGSKPSSERISSALRQQLTSPFRGNDEPSLRLLLLWIFIEKARGNHDFMIMVNKIMVNIPASEMDKKSSEILLSLSEFDQQRMNSFIGHLMELHAFSETALMGMFQAARSKTLISTSEFRWLQYVDRALFYAIDSVGRRSFFPESLGCATHFMRERDYGEALHDINMTAGVECLLAALTIDDEP